MTFTMTLRLALLAALFASGKSPRAQDARGAHRGPGGTARPAPIRSSLPTRKLVWDFWREVLEVGHMEQAEKLSWPNKHTSSTTRT